MKKKKCFDYSNNYLEKIISNVINISTTNMGYTESGTHYYYWYNAKDRQVITDNINNIKEDICKLEKCNAHVTDYQCEEGQIVLILFKE